jgi:hypothetical protein
MIFPFFKSGLRLRPHDCTQKTGEKNTGEIMRFEEKNYLIFEPETTGLFIRDRDLWVFPGLNESSSGTMKGF